MRVPLLFALLGSVCMSGCMAASFQDLGVKSRHSTGEVALPPEPQPSPMASADTALVSKNQTALTLSMVEPRRVVYTGNFTVVVLDVTAAQDASKKMAEDMGGYVQRLSSEQVVLRVPADKFDAAVAALGKLGWIASRDINSEDVSDKYTDIDIRIKNAKALKDRLVLLLEKNSNHQEVIQMEQELARVTTQIEELEAQMNRLSNQIAYATLTIRFAPKPQNLPPELRVQLPFEWLHSLGLSTLMSFNGRNLY